MQLAHDRNDRGPHCSDISPRTPQSLQAPWAFHPPHSKLNQLTLCPKLLLCLRPFLNIAVYPTRSARNPRNSPAVPSAHPCPVSHLITPVLLPQCSRTTSTLPSAAPLRPELCQCLPIISVSLSPCLPLIHLGSRPPSHTSLDIP